MLIPPDVYLEILHDARTSVQRLITDHIRANHDPRSNIEVNRATISMLHLITLDLMLPDLANALDKLKVIKNDP